MQRKCEACDREYEAKRKTSRFCSNSCRSNNRYGKNKPVVDSPLVAATRAELAAAGKVETRLGQQALVLAAQMAGVQSAAGIGTLSKELDRVVSAAIGTTLPIAPAGEGDSVDELRARRDAKRAG